MYKMICVQPAVVISSVLNDSCMKWSSPALELARMQSFGGHEEISLQLTLSNHWYPVILMLHQILGAAPLSQELVLYKPCVLSVAFCGKAVLAVTSCVSCPGFGKSEVTCWDFFLVQWVELSFTGYSMPLASYPAISHDGWLDVVWLSLNLQSKRWFCCAMHWSNTEQGVSVAGSFQLSNLSSFPATSVSLMKYVLSPLWQYSFKQALGWENGRVWRKNPQLPRVPVMSTVWKSVVVMSSKNVSIISLRLELET